MIKMFTHRVQAETHQNGSLSSGGFSLVELLVVICVIGILGAMIITSISNASRDSRWTIARQQQATLQGALNSWIAANASLADAREAYNGTNVLGKLDMLSDYLQTETYADFLSNSTASSIRSRILDRLEHHLTFAEWNQTNQPSVQLATNTP